MKHTILVTGGAGFIGSALVRYLLTETDSKVIILDKLTYAGNLSSLATVSQLKNFLFIEGDIGDCELVTSLLKLHKPNAIMHLAAESHVDRSIDGPADFIQTNIVGTYVLLEAAKEYFLILSEADKIKFRFHHISTDEVYGDLEPEGFFTEDTPYSPSSPYSATKASSDHLVRAWSRTYGLPILITNCSNNYGPFHFPEKLIPLMIINALHGKPLTIYGDGMQIRDWLFVDDHVKALYQVLEKGVIGETYNIGGFNEKTNLDVVNKICEYLNEVIVNKPAGVLDFKELIEFIEDRPGHDVRYAIDATKINKEIAWYPKETFETGIKKTIDWYLNNKTWWQEVLDGSYKLERLGKGSI